MANILDGLSILFKNRLFNLLNSHGALVDAFITFHQVQPELQIGPTCGFASLLTAMKCLGFMPEDLNLDNLVEMAKQYGITNSGELFSAQWLCEFVEHQWPGQFQARMSEFSDPSEIVRHLAPIAGSRNQMTILVPYDCDKNFEPCYRNGHTAHWALIVGFVILCPSEQNKGEIEVPTEHRVFIFEEDNFLGKELNEDNLFLIAYQGKSRHPALWSYRLLSQSNAQLEVPNPVGAANFRMAPEGMEAIRGRCVLFGSGERRGGER